MLMKTRCVAKAEEAVAHLKEQGVDAAQEAALRKRLAAMKAESAEEQAAAEQAWAAQKAVFESEALQALLARARSDGAGAEGEESEGAARPAVDQKTLATEHGVTPAGLAALHRYAHYLYSTGAHEAARGLLQQFLEVSAHFAEAAEVAEVLVVARR